MLLSLLQRAESRRNDLKTLIPELRFQTWIDELKELDIKISKRKAGHADVLEDLESLKFRQSALRVRLEPGVSKDAIEDSLGEMKGMLLQHLSVTRIASKISEDDWVRVLTHLKIMLARTPGDENESSVLRSNPTAYW